MLLIVLSVGLSIDGDAHSAIISHIASESYSREDVLSALSEVLDDDLILDSLNPITDDDPSPIPSSSSSNPPLRDLNSPFETRLFSGRSSVTPAPAVRSALARTRSTSGPFHHFKGAVLHSAPLRNDSPDEDWLDQIARWQYLAWEQDGDDSYSTGLGFNESFDDRLNKSLKWVRPTFAITGISPDFCENLCRTTVKLTVVPPTPGHCYCRFREIIVKGFVDVDGVASCKVPKLWPGAVPVHFSRDRKNWFGPVEFRYGVVTGGLNSLLLFLPVGMCIIGVGGVGAYALTLFAKSRTVADEGQAVAFLPRGREK
jgi:hypothetical protein